MLDLDDALDRLAPEVDLAASRELFDRRRAQPARSDDGRRPRPVLVGVAAALVLVLGVAAIVVATRDRETTLHTADDAAPDATPAPPSTAGSGPVAFELLGMDRATESAMGTLQAATDAAQLEELWTAAGIDGAVPAVDLDRWVVVSMTIPDDACPPELTGFDRAGEVVTAVFVEPAGGCIDPLVPKTYVAAIDRAAVTPRFTLRLPAYEYFFDEKTLVVEVPPTTSGGGAPPAPTAATEAERLGTVALPAVGTFGSGLLDDRTPVWVVHHPDATVSVLPALVDDGFVGERTNDVPLPHPAELTDTLEVVHAVGSSGFRSNDVAWDPWGRTTTHDRARDLVGYAGVVVDGRVQVVASAVAPIPGEPQGLVDDGPGTPPAVPDLAPSIDAVTPGWNRLVDVYLGGKGDVFRICPYPTGTETLDYMGNQSMEIVETCDGPVVAGVTGPPDAWAFAFGEPFLVQVDETGAVVGVGMVLRSGGASGSDD